MIVNFQAIPAAKFFEMKCNRSPILLNMSNLLIKHPVVADWFGSVQENVTEIEQKKSED